ncbi:MAG: NfeD family protein [Cellulosilyticaceae bacterium]
MSFIWLIASAIFFISQKLYGGLLLMSFSLSCLITFLLSLLLHNALLELLICLLLPLILTFTCYRSYIKKHAKSRALLYPLDYLVGKQAIVTQTIGPTPLESGLIKLDNELWHAFSSNQEIIPSGSIVKVESLKGICAQVTLITH